MVKPILHPELKGHFLGVGSLVEESDHSSLRDVVKLKLPYTYQRPVKHEEDMIRQFGALLDGFEDNGTFIYDTDYDTYRRIIEEENTLVPSEKFFSSLYKMKEEKNFPFLKTQVTAPATMCFSIRGSDGRQLLTPQMFKFFTSLISKIMKGYESFFSENVEQLVICQDDPSFGFVLEAVEVGNVPGLSAKHIMDVTESIFPANVIPAYHYCYDWRVLSEHGHHLIWNGEPKIAHLDMITYPPKIDEEQSELINQYLERGGGIALGVLPNIDSSYDSPVIDYFERSLKRTLVLLKESGVSLTLLENNIMVSTQCGLSGASAKLAKEIHENDKKYPQILTDLIKTIR